MTILAADIAMNGWLVRHAIRAAGEVLLTVGLVGLLFIGYLIWGTGAPGRVRQRALSSELNQQWQRRRSRRRLGARADSPDVATGHPFAFIKIPASASTGSWATLKHQQGLSPRVTAGNPLVPAVADGRRPGKR